MKIWEAQSEYKPVCLRFDSKKELYDFLDMLNYVIQRGNKACNEYKIASTIKELISKL